MLCHRQILVAAGAAVRDSTAVLNECVASFGCGLSVHVGAYPDGIPGAHDAPFLWLFADADIDSSETNSDSVFTIHGIVGACVVDASGEKRICDVVTPRTASANGLAVNGGNAAVEALRDKCLCAIREAKCGAIVSTTRRRENDVSHYPLEWAALEVDFLEPESL